MKQILLILIFCTAILGQTLIPDVNIDAKRMDSSKKKDIQELKEAIESYIYNNSFSNDDYDYEIPFKIQIFVESVDQSSTETNFNCQAFFTNEGDQRYVESSWRFPFSRGTPIYRSGLYDPIGSMIDFYGYLICATELDGIELNAGTSLFSTAQEVIELASMSKYSGGWPGRQKIIDSISGNFRLRKSRLLFNECYWGIEDKMLKEAKVSLEEALKLLEQNIYLKNRDKYTRIFIESHYQDSKYFSEVFQDTFFLPAFRRLSPGNEDYFNRLVDEFK